MAVHAGEVLAEQVIDRVFAVGQVVDHHYAVAHLHRRLDRVGQAAARGVGLFAVGIVEVADDEAVHHDLDGVHLVAFQLDLFGQVEDLTINARAHEARLADVVQDALVAALAVLDHGREHLDARAVRPALDSVHDLLRRLPYDFFAANRAVGDADARVEQAHVVVNLGDGADRRARVVAHALLVDGDRRRQALDLVHIGLVHLAEELARVS